MARETALDRKLKALPEAPGVYLLKDRRGTVLYVGKARNLRLRVRSYFSHGTGDGRRLLPFLRARLRDFDTIVVDSEKEAFLLENDLIKQHRPRYNVRLVDDKTYLSLRLDRRHPFPRLTTVRRRRRDGARYFGPYASAAAVRSTLKLVHRSFGLRSCSDAVLANRTRPCLYYQIGQCLAPCVGYVTREDYAEAVHQAELLLAGRSRELEQRLRLEMTTLAAAERFEEAARVRDKLRSVDKTLERQDVSALSGETLDLVAHASGSQEHAFQWLCVRDGRIVDSVSRVVHDPGMTDLAHLYSTVLAQAYEDRPIPATILVSLEIAERAVLEQVLTDRRSAPVRIQVPARGSKRRLLELAAANARLTLAIHHDHQSRSAGLLTSLAELLSLRRPPRRIECFDISHLGGALTVGAMSVMVDGQITPSQYRRYRIRTETHGDDPAGLSEALTRRLTRGRDERLLPDLLVIDGGAAQVAVAEQLCRQLELDDVALVGLAKGPRRNAGREIIHLADGRAPIRLPANDPRLHLLQRIRDEAHRFAVGYQRRLRRQRDRTSPLDALPGIGPVLSRRLRERFGSLEAVRQASLDALRSVTGLGPSTAVRLYRHLHPENRDGAARADGEDERSAATDAARSR